MSFGYNSTINRKKKPCKNCGLPSYIFSRGRCEPCSRIEDTQKRMEAETEKVIAGEDLSGLVDDCDRLVSRYVRLSGADENGECECYTCGDKKHWSFMQAGHFIGRACMYLRHDLRNLKIQCPICNEVNHGAMSAYHARLEKEYPGLPDLLKEESRVVYKVSRDELRQLVAEFTPKVKALQSKFKIK